MRETYINSIEAQATKIEFGIEWQAVEEKGVYRRVVADNGRGMTPEELVGFFNVWGGGGKPIGGLHENFGIGAKAVIVIDVPGPSDCRRPLRDRDAVSAGDR